MPSEARAVAYQVLRRTFEHGAFTDRAFQQAAAALDARDRALAQHLAYGAVQRALTLDHLIERLSGRATARIDAPLLAALRLGCFELCFAGSAAHAVVNDAVELAKPAHGHALVNAVLRRAAREGPELVEGLSDEDPAGASLRHSMPLWIVERWWEALGPERARALLARANEPAESSLRANTLRTDAGALVAALAAQGVAAKLGGDPPEAVIALEAFDAHASALWREGALMPQSRASMLVAHCVAPPPGGRVLDLCAAPGGKTTHLAALMGARGEVIAVERHPGRARALQRTAERMGATNVTVAVGDATRPRPRGERYDRVLVDAPCSGLGTLQARPDRRWRASADSVRSLAEQQARLLSAAAAACAPGGTLVYSTCTISVAENERQIGAFLDANPQFEAVDLQARHPAWAHPLARQQLLALGSVQGSDGFFIAALERV
ncbi:MAG TPA: 16S rRNA (cytosine(967)-C(5))-methyltransferase RsmB [Solirubrobacteraceae bacterium]|nr:16S rRNA (cytosine(967)-C(5))-methyltransferase RsmB [Solirubrobacteraceae bacterium]